MAANLDGIRVLDFTQVLSGPTATRYLAEMGAMVIKVEAPPGGDITRSSPRIRDGRSGYFVNANRGKRSICVNLKDPRGTDLMLSMLPTIDVVIQNFSPGAIDRLGLGWNELSAIKPDLIMCSISGFGHTGPLSHLPGYDGAAAAYSGMLAINGELDRPPALPGAPMGDVLTGTAAAAGILSALFHRERTGEGQHIQTSILDSYLSAHDTAFQTLALTDGDIVQGRAGSQHPVISGYGVFPVADGDVFIGAGADRHWHDLCDAMGRQDLYDPSHKWSVRTTRDREILEVNALIAAWSVTLTKHAAIDLLQRHRVPCGPILEVDEVAALPEFHESGHLRTVTDPILGPLTLPSFGLRSSQTDMGFDTEAPHLGEHNRDVLLDLSGGADAYAELVDAGVIHDPEPSARPSRQR